MTSKLQTNGELAEVYGGPLELKDSVWSLLEDGMIKNPDKTALVSVHQSPNHLKRLVGPGSATNSGPYLSWTYDQMKSGAFRLRSAFTAAGIQPGSVLMSFIPNCAEWTLLFWTAALMELNFVPLDARILELARVEEFTYLLQSLKPSAIVVESAAQAEIIDEADKRLRLELNLKVCLAQSIPSRPSWWTFGGLADLGTEALSDVAPVIGSKTMDRVALIIFTSGTSTGRPKGCPWTVTMLAALAQQDFFWNLSSSTMMVITSANFRIICALMSFSAWHIGATVVLPANTFSPAATIEAIDKCAGSMMLLVPAQVHAVFRDPTYSKESVRSMAHTLVGGDVITVDFVNKVREIFPNSAVIPTIGMTEGAGVIGWPRVMDPTTLQSYQGTVGLGSVLPGSRLRVSDDGVVKKRGQVGDLHIASPGVIDHYLDNVRPELFYEENGVQWHNTGDRAIIDNEGIVHVIGRSKDIVKRAGIPIAPAGLESCLEVHGKTRAQVIGIPHPTLGEEPFAVIESLDKGVDAADLETLIVDMFGKEYALGGVLTLAQLRLSEWPLNATGKVLKLELKEAALVLLEKGRCMGSTHD